MSHSESTEGDDDPLDMSWSHVRGRKEGMGAQQSRAPARNAAASASYASLGRRRASSSSLQPSNHRWAQRAQGRHA